MSGILKGNINAFKNRDHIVKNLVGRHGVPIGDDHITGDIVDGLALQLLGNQITVGILPGPDIGETKIKSVPGKAKIGFRDFFLR